MSGDFEYNDQYTPTIDDNLTLGKVVLSGLSAHDRKRQAWWPGAPSGGASL